MIKIYKNSAWHPLTGTKIAKDGVFHIIKPEDKFYINGAWHEFGYLDYESALPAFDLVTEPTPVGSVIYTTPAGAGTKSGADWANAIDGISNAITLATSDDVIYMSAGEYTSPTTSITGSITIYGGFEDGGAWATRGWDNKTVITGAGVPFTAIENGDGVAGGNAIIDGIRFKSYTEGVIGGEIFSDYPPTGTAKNCVFDSCDDVISVFSLSNCLAFKCSSKLTPFLANITDCVLIGCNCSGIQSRIYGGAILIAGTATRSEFYNCNSINTVNSYINVIAGKLIDCKLKNCKVSGYGDCYMAGADTAGYETSEDTTFTNCDCASTSSTAVSAIAENLANCLIQNCNAGIFTTGTMEFCTIVRSTADELASGDVTDTVLYACTITTVDFGSGTNSIAHETNSLTKFASVGTVTLIGYATALRGENTYAFGNYQLLTGSSLIGAGVAISGITTDIDGITRLTPPAIGAYEYSGTIRVSTLEDGAWSIDGGTTYYDSDEEVRVDPGTYTITFKPVTGYTTPADQTITLADGDSSTATGTYTAKGTLTVTIENDGSPDLPDASFGRWSIDGGTTYNDSGDSLTLDAGTYTITYKEISYRLSPADESVTIYAGGSYSTTGTYVTCGALNVRTNYYYGTGTYIGQWSVNGGTDWHKPDGSFKLAAGLYTVTFKAVDGYTTPSDLSVGVSDGNTNFSSNNDYVAKSNLTVTTDPTRGEWSINGGDRWEDSGDKIYIVPGTYTLTFKAIYGYTTPADQTITLADGDSSTATGTYTAKGTLTVTTDPTSGYWGTDPYETWNMSMSGDSMTLDAGTYTVYFGDITGYTAPSSQSVTITDGNDTAITGTYTAD